MSTRAATDRIEGPRLTAVCVGRPELRGMPDAERPSQRPWTSAIWKAPVAGPVRVHRTGVDGDAQADTRVHGGPEKAVLAYAVAHYDGWRDVLDPASLGPGAFGENLAIAGLDEQSVAIGDVLAIGTARLEVCQPRAPCWKLVRKFDCPELVERVIANGRTGWYLRVLTDGTLTAGDAIDVVARPHAELTLDRLHRVLYDQPLDREAAAAFATCAALTAGVRERIAHKLE